MATAVDDRVRKYRATFDRIGRNRGLSGDGIAQDFESAPDADDLALKIHRFVRGKLASRDVEVHVDLEKMTGAIVVGGFQSAGTFTLQELK